MKVNYKHVLLAVSLAAVAGLSALRPDLAPQYQTPVATALGFLAMLTSSVLKDKDPS
jgi:hypothetical protein